MTTLFSSSVCLLISKVDCTCFFFFKAQVGHIPYTQAGTQEMPSVRHGAAAAEGGGKEEGGEGGWLVGFPWRRVGIPAKILLPTTRTR